MVGGWLPKPSPKDTSNQKGLVTLIPFCPCQHCWIFVKKTHLHDQQTSQYLLNNGRYPDLATDQYTRSKVGYHSEAEIKTRGNEIYGWPHPSHLCPCQIMDLKVTEVHHQLPHQCHQCLRDWEILGIHAMANSPTGNPEAIWRSTCQSSKMRTLRTLSHTKVGTGT